MEHLPSPKCTAARNDAFGTPMKMTNPTGLAEEDDDLCSTAVPSAEPSPSKGPLKNPSFALDEAVLGPALAELDTWQGSSDQEEHVQELQLQQRIEWYLSAENLCHDHYLRSRMDELGWVQLGDILQAAGLSSLSTNVEDAGTALKASQHVQVSEDFKKVRAVDPMLQAAFAPRDMQESTSPLSPRSAVQPECCTEADVDNSLLSPSIHVIALGPASKEGGELPCVQWLTSEPCVSEECLEWLVSEPDPDEYAPTFWRPDNLDCQRREKITQRRLTQETEVGLELFWVDSDSDAPPMSPSSAAWMRLSDDAYPCAAASLLGW